MHTCTYPVTTTAMSSSTTGFIPSLNQTSLLRDADYPVSEADNGSSVKTRAEPVHYLDSFRHIP